MSKKRKQNHNNYYKTFCYMDNFGEYNFITSQDMYYIVKFDWEYYSQFTFYKVVKGVIQKTPLKINSKFRHQFQLRGVIK